MGIYRVKEYDLLATAITNGNYYVCTDSKKMYRDYGSSRRLIDVTFINTEVDRLRNTRPSNGINYYVWETNTLWFYNAGWTILQGEETISSGYYYQNNMINPTSDVTPILDNNGLLADGSVVVRDMNRIIKGKIYLDENNNLVISSFLGGGLVFLPSGDMNTTGTLQLTSSNTYTGEYDEDGNPISTPADSGIMKFYGSIVLTDGTNDYKLVRITNVPENSDSDGKSGDIAYDENYLYICVSDNNWKRIGLTTW